jgi:hypothetical protein
MIGPIRTAAGTSRETAYGIGFGVVFPYMGSVYVDKLLIYLASVFSCADFELKSASVAVWSSWAWP